MNKPIVIAHRGGAALAPENSLKAFTRALDAGVDGVELDVQLGDNGELIVIHDVLEPDDLCLGAPRLDAVLDLIQTIRPDACVVIDVKAAPWRQDRRDQGCRLIDAAVDPLALYPRGDRLVLASFDWDALEHASKRLPASKIAFHTMAARWLVGLSPQQTGLTDSSQILAYLEAWRQARGPGYEALSPLEMMRGSGAHIWSCHHRDLTASSVTRARGLGLQVWTWTVNAPADLERVLDLGVDAVTTDWPDHVVNYLATGTWSE